MLESAAMRRYWVYIISNKSRRLYTGFTDDLARRAFEHKYKIFPNSFTAKYVYDVLVFFEEYSHFSTAKTRERNQGLATREEGEANSRREP